MSRSLRILLVTLCPGKGTKRSLCFTEHRDGTVTGTQKVLLFRPHCGFLTPWQDFFRIAVAPGATGSAEPRLHDLGQPACLWRSPTSPQENVSHHETLEACRECQVRSRMGNALKMMKYFSQEKVCYN